MSSEQWKPVPGYEGLYEVSSFGRIRSYKNGKWGVRTEPKIVEGQVGKHYKTIPLCNGSGKRTHYVHRLVAEAFVPRMDGKTYVNHMNGNKLDNRAENLEWCTQKENLHHAEKSGLLDYNKRAIVCVESGKEFSSIMDAARELNIGQSSISSCLSGRYKSAGGLHFRDKGANTQ